MPMKVMMVVFISFAVLVTVGQHYYIWRRLIRDPKLPRAWRWVATAALFFAAACIPVTFIVVRLEAPGNLRAFAWPAYIWMGTVFLIFFGMLGWDMARLAVKAARKIAHKRTPVDPARRVFLARAAAGAVTVSAGSASAWGVRNAALPVEVKRVEVTLPRLPAALSGMTIVQLTDLHLGPLLGREWLEGIVRRTNALKPDLIAITGDLVDGKVSSLGSTTALLAKLCAPQGVFFVTGNHEYYSGAPQWCAELTRLGIRVLRNERVSVGKGEDSFDLAGIDDHNARRHLPDHGPDLARALRGRDATRELILLAHQPRAIHEAAAHGVGLALCGHTHGGQLWPWTFFVGLQQPYVSGLHRHGERTQIYVSEGTGYWGPPMRLGTRCEITRVVLRAV
jgi:uncharacterized protein